ncbi:bile acid:sodium symporter family protein [Paractinoplanes lichenicola]|uniref:Bile acid:sodium symporter n=1 Tax=Paractinoplanes lichenicola TaxID=2802976 RepID=A0ABS1VEJ1_9ACTN|nr:hypothetical protein [Actinoplanes lichenicola]MBL7253099.1 hypothetical protein [Actinoplanes lichenicola]
MDSPLTTVGLPVALGIIMLGLGLGLTVADFWRVVAYPRAALIALGCQVLLLPALCFALVVALDLPAVLAVGMMLLAASPGGTTANLYSHLFGGHVALNVTLTAVNSVLAVVTLPIVVNLSAGYFLDGAGSLGLQFDKVVQVFAIVLVPVAVSPALLGNTEMAIPAAVYGVVMFFTAAAFGYLVTRQREREVAEGGSRTA